MRQVLQSEAAAAGIHPDRLLFAPIVDKTAHLSRLIFVDLFLDTLFYNAHTTAADALWMHVPIITFAGSTFASRVAGSLITHLSEPDFTSILITHSVKEFEAVAVDIASPDQNQARFIALNLHLTRGTLFGSTFNTQATTSHLEASYQIMWDLTQGGTIPSPKKCYGAEKRINKTCHLTVQTNRTISINNSVTFRCITMGNCSSRISSISDGRPNMCLCVA